MNSELISLSCKMNKVIFLDIDGVLRVETISRDGFGPTFHEQFVENLRYIIEQTGADIVISSTWKQDGLSTLRRMWNFRDLPGNIIDITPNFNSVIGIRGEEIEEWLRCNWVDRYCIIDDLDDDFLFEQMSYFVHTANNFDHEDNIRGYGLTKRCTEEAIRILNE